MGILMSLPILSLFALPAVSNYSTSINLLFFWMTWTTLVLSHPPLRVELFGSLFIRILFYFIPSLIFLLFDTFLPSLAESIKAQGDIGLPGLLGRKRVIRVAALSTFNILFGMSLLAGVELLSTEVLHMPSRLKISTRLPMPFSIIKDLTIGLLARNLLQFYIHRHILHAPKSNFLTRLHQSYQHSIRAPFSFVAHYDHPLPWFIAHWIPLYLPPMLLRMHMLTFQLLLALTSLEEALTYSGYTVLPSTIMLTGMARRCDAHFMSEGDGNFAPWGVLDWVHGTSLGGDVSDDMRAEIDKRGLDNKADNFMNSANKRLNNASNSLQGKGKGEKKKK